MRISRFSGLLATFALAAAATAALTTSVYANLTHPTRVTAALLVLLIVHVLRYLRLWLSRELLMALVFLGYALLSLAWTDNIRAGLVTVPSMVNFALGLTLFSALAAFHNLRAVLAGVVAGFALAAVLYTLTSGFPFALPEDFSYNSIAAMYFFGFLMTITYGAYIRRTLLPLSAAAILLLLVAGTTSIKYNLGSALGVIGATTLYFQPSIKSISRAILVLVALAGGVAYLVGSNPDLSERVHNGFTRVSLGFSVLADTRERYGVHRTGNPRGMETGGTQRMGSKPGLW